MHRLATEIIGATVFSVHTGNRIGEVTGLLVRHKDFKIELLVVKTPEIEKSLYLLSSDIRAYDNNKIIIDSYQELSEADDLLRHQVLIKEDSKLFNSKVETHSGKYLGKVKDYSLDTNHFFINKIYITANWPLRLLHERLIVDRADIIEVNNKKIIVRDATIKAKSNAKVLPAQS